MYQVKCNAPFYVEKKLKYSDFSLLILLRGRTGCYNWYQSRSVRPAKLLSPSCLTSFNPLVRDMCVETLSVLLSFFLFDCVQDRLKAKWGRSFASPIYRL